MQTVGLIYHKILNALLRADLLTFPVQDTFVGYLVSLESLFTKITIPHMKYGHLINRYTTQIFLPWY